MGKSAMSGLTISLGLVSTQGDLFTLKEAESNKADKMNLVCPECDEPVGMNQYYACKNGLHTDLTVGQCDHGKMVGDKMVRITENEIKDAKESELPDKSLSLSVHDAAEVRSRTFPVGLAYVFIPTTGKLDLYAVMKRLLADRPDLVFMGVMLIKKNEKLVGVTLGLDGHILIQELVWPTDLKEFTGTGDDVVDEKQFAMAELIADGAKSDFVPEDYVKTSRIRLQEIAEAKASGAVPTPKKGATKVDQAQDLTAILQAALTVEKAS